MLQLLHEVSSAVSQHSGQLPQPEPRNARPGAHL